MLTTLQESANMPTMPFVNRESTVPTSFTKREVVAPGSWEVKYSAGR
jgi:hypothetical protein